MTLVAPVIAAMILGAMLFFSGVIAPLIFTRLPEDQAGLLIRNIFPWYYIVLGTLAAAAVPFAQGLTSKVLLAATAIGLLAARFIAIPMINAARDAALAGDANAQARFDMMHQATVVLNGLEILALIAVIVLAMRQVS